MMGATTKRAFKVFRRLAVETRATEIAEAAAVLPLMFMILLGIFWFGQAFSIYGAITRAAQEGARAGAAPYLHDLHRVKFTDHECHQCRQQRAQCRQAGSIFDSFLSAGSQRVPFHRYHQRYLPSERSVRKIPHSAVDHRLGDNSRVRNPGDVRVSISFLVAVHFPE